jgi:hypothetical protein
MVRAALRTSCKRAGRRIVGAHVPTHTLSSFLAMDGAAPKANPGDGRTQSLKGTLRDVHLIVAALRDTIARSSRAATSAKDGGWEDEVPAR